MAGEPKSVKREMWIVMLTGLSGLFERDYEVDLLPLEDGKIRTTITFDAAKEWVAARLFMALLDSNYGPFEVNKIRGVTRSHVEVSFMWPAWIECPYVTPKA